MAKPFKDLDEQIDYLEKTKAIRFLDRKLAKNELLNKNYYNLISCSKIMFAEKIENGVHCYPPHDFQEWLDYFEMDCMTSEYLMGNLIEFERIINSRLSYYCCEMIEGGLLSANKKNELIQEFQRIEVKDMNKYQGKETWKYVTQMSFGKAKNLLIWLLENQVSYFNKIVVGFDFLRPRNASNRKDLIVSKNKINDIVNLRNNIFHFTPLSIYLGHARRRDHTYDNTFRKQIVEFVWKQKPDKQVRINLNQIITATDHFVAIKNSQ